MVYVPNAVDSSTARYISAGVVPSVMPTMRLGEADRDYAVVAALPVETPGLCKQFGRCWNCYEGIDAGSVTCPSCLTGLEYLEPREVRRSPTLPGATGPSTKAPPTPQQLQELSAAIGATEVARREAVWDEPPRIGRLKVTWIAVAIIVIVIAVLMWITKLREQSTKKSPRTTYRWFMAPAEPRDAASTNIESIHLSTHIQTWTT